jgi:hypothetical protein
MSAAEVTADTPFAPEDDQYHRLSDDPFETETNWWSLNWPERRMGCWAHAAYYPNRGSVTTRLFVWDEDGATPGQLAYYKNTGEQPMPPNPDLRDITFPGGYHHKMLKPAMDYHVTYADPERNFAIEFEHRSVHPPRRFTPGEAPALHNPHFDQLGHITGELKLRGEKIPIDCYSVRDRTWGPRGGRHSQSQKTEYATPRSGVSGCRIRAVRAGARSSASGAVGACSTSSATADPTPASSASSERRTGMLRVARR